MMLESVLRTIYIGSHACY